MVCPTVTVADSSNGSSTGVESVEGGLGGEIPGRALSTVGEAFAETTDEGIAVQLESVLHTEM